MPLRARCSCRRRTCDGRPLRVVHARGPGQHIHVKEVIPGELQVVREDDAGDESPVDLGGGSFDVSIGVRRRLVVCIRRQLSPERWYGGLMTRPFLGLGMALSLGKESTRSRFRAASSTRFRVSSDNCSSFQRSAEFSFDS